MSNVNREGANEEIEDFLRRYSSTQVISPLINKSNGSVSFSGALLTIEELNNNKDNSHQANLSLPLNLNASFTNEGEKNKCVKNLKSFWLRFRGFIFMIMSCIFLSLGALIVKYMTNYHKSSLALWRFLGIWIPSVLIVGLKLNTNILDPIWPPMKDRRWVTLLLIILRSFVASTAVIFYFFSLRYLNVADALVIISTTPIFVNFAAAIFLKEPCGIFPFFTAILTVIGVLIVMKPPILTGGASFDEEVLIGSGLALAVTLCMTTSVIILRRLRKVHYSVLTMFMGGMGVITSIVVSFILFGNFQKPKGTHDICLVVILAILSYLGQSCITLALKFEQAGPVSLIRTCEVLFAFLWQFLFLGVAPDLYSIGGAVIVIFSIFLTVFRTWLLSRPPEHTLRKRLFCILK